MPNAASIRLLLAELREERLKKARMGLGALNHHATMVPQQPFIVLNDGISINAYTRVSS